MDSSMSYLPISPASLVLLILGISLLDYVANCWFELNRNTASNKVPTATNGNNASVNRYMARNSLFEDETPIGRNCGLRHLQLRHRVKLMAGVKRRLDQDF